ncbi:MAG: hydrogenase maturation nickel metallochaperone HypA [Lachnospiraceae bacterium]|jgi:hydrogenase nickel incorporation protein HypA/HybF|nr:hydrogenase maturation nickel metallochaperone HypA [Lachnospiraceae bacterium]
MHEMSYVVRFVNLALQKAQENRAVRVRSLTVSVGEMTDIVPEYLHKYYPEAVSGTIMEGSALKVEVIPVRIRCAGCGEVYHPEKGNAYACPVCGDSAGEICGGRGMQLTALEMETEDG